MARVRELTITYRPHRSGATIDSRTLADPQTAIAVLRPILQHEAQEVFIVLMLNAKYKLLSVYEAARGGRAEVHIDPAIVFRAALIAGASAIVIAHNHPSGDCQPSVEDWNLTRRLQAAGQLLTIPVLDHVIIADDCATSFKQTGRMEVLAP